MGRKRNTGIWDTTTTTEKGSHTATPLLFLTSVWVRFVWIVRVWGYLGCLGCSRLFGLFRV